MALQPPRIRGDIKSALRTASRVVAALLLLGVAVLFVNAIFGFGSTGFHDALHSYGFGAVSVISAIVVLSRVALVPRHRTGWLLFGLGTATLGIGDLYLTTVVFQMAEPIFPSYADIFYLVSYPLLGTGLFFLLRDRLQRPAKTMWLDAAICGVAMVSIGTGLLMGPISETTGTLLQTGVAAAYPIFDVALFAMIAAVVALTGSRVDRALGAVMLAMASIGFADVVFFYQTAAGTYVEGTFIDVFWPLGGALFATAAWARSPVTRLAPAPGVRALILPSALALSVVFLELAIFDGVFSEVFAILTVVLLVTRMMVGIAENQALVSKLGSDVLTGLGNRGRLAADISRALAFGRPHTLVMADLDGFKLYNDSFGHPAGDAMLSRLGGALATSVEGKGQAYRVGGDEFCVLLDGPAAASKDALSAISGGLSEHGAGFRVAVSLGSVELPAEAASAEDALHISDQRMYANKDSRRDDVQERDALTVLVNAQRERRPKLGERVDGVSRLAVKVGGELGLQPGEVGILRRAAELHDIGKIAIPDAIINKPDRLTDEEWSFMRQHTILGERILSSAKSLEPYARIVRSSHERIDGEGYPDGLSGREIPLASRIIFACDAFNAMITERPYASRRSRKEATAELRRCANSQFDSRVVDALCNVLDAGKAGEVTASETDAAAPGRQTLIPAPA